MSKYTIELPSVFKVIVAVEANDEGEALTKAHTLADEADMSEYQFVKELQGKVLNVQ